MSSFLAFSIESGRRGPTRKEILIEGFVHQQHAKQPNLGIEVGDLIQGGLLGRPSLKDTVFDWILGPNMVRKILQFEPSFLCRVCDTWQARRCLQSS